MGDIADMILEGELCQECGAYMDGADGYPRTCHSCKRGSSIPIVKQGTAQAKVNCPRCMKRVKRVGLSNHMKDVHGEKS